MGQGTGVFPACLGDLCTSQDGYSGSIVLRSLARLRQTSGDAGLPTVLAPVLRMTPPEAEALLRSIRNKEPGLSSG